jgi:HK97 family phage major capsid protein
MSQKLQQFLSKGNRPFYSQKGGETKTIGQQFVESDEYKNYFSKGQNHSDAMTFNTKALLSSDGAGGLIGGSYEVPGIVGGYGAVNTIRGLLNRQSIDTNSVYYMEQTDFTNNAAMQVEGELKGESAMTLEERMATVKTIAHFLSVSNQALADIVGLSNFIDNQLMSGLRLVEEQQLLFGSGTGEDLTGLMVNTNVQDIGIMGTGKTMPDHIRSAITMAVADGDVPNGIILNPVDWEVIETSKDTTGQYITANIATGAESRLWRVPVVQSSAMPEGSFLVGAFNSGATIFERENASIKISDHHADYFARNMKAVLCESRLALAITKPISFCKGSFATA